MKKASLRWLLFLIPLIVLAPFMSKFFYVKDSNFSDLSITFYPNALYVHQSVFQYHTFPLWTDAILSGYPFSADSQAGLWYLPMWLVNLLPSPHTFNLLIIFHFILAGVGVYLFLRREGLHELPALAGGLLFELMPKLWAHYGAGHISLVMAVCWTPWLLLAETEFIRSHLSLQRMVYPGVVLGLIILTNVTWAPFAFLIWVTFATAKQIKFLDCETTKRKIIYVAKRFGWGVVQGLLAMLISAPLWLPLLTFTQLSSRALMTTADNMTYSLPLLNIINLFIPNFSAMHEMVLYPGIITLFFVIVLLFSRNKPALTWFWIVVGGVCLIFSFGDNLPLIPFLYRLPFLNLLRVPTRFYFISCLSASLLAAMGIEQFLFAAEKVSKGMRLLWIGFSFLISLLSLGTGGLKLMFIWVPLMVVVNLGVLFTMGKLSRLPRVQTALLVALMLVDVFGVDLLSLKFHNPGEVLAEGAEVVDYVASQPGKFRTYSPSYSLPQQTAMGAGIQLADGVNPLQLMDYVNFMEKATGIPIHHYTVTMPDFPNSKPATDNAQYQPDPHLLGLLNVRFVLSAYDLQNTDMTLVRTIHGTRVYENHFWLPRAWVQPVNAPLGEQILSSPEISLAPNVITLIAEGPGLLVLSEIAYPGWKVTLNGSPAEVLEPMGLLRGVAIPSGTSTVRFEYHPTDVFVGIGLAGLGWIIAIFFLLVKSKRHLIDGK
jgi:hypothetical protein